MYPKVKTVRRGGRSYEYLELVEGRREGARVRQHVVANLGRLDELTASGKLEQLAAGLARLHQPPPGTRRHVGPLLIVAHYLRALGVAGIIDAALPRRGRALAGVALYFRPQKGAANELPAFAAAIEALAAALPPGLVVVADSGLGYLENLCAADARSVKFVVPLRASTGWAARFTAEVPGGLGALAVLDHVSYREKDLPAARRTVWKGLLAPVPVTHEHGARHDLRAAYILSSEPAASVADR